MGRAKTVECLSLLANNPLILKDHTEKNPIAVLVYAIAAAWEGAAFTVAAIGSLLYGGVHYADNSTVTTVDDILKDARPESKTRGRSNIWTKTGTEETAEEDFEKLTG